MLQPHIVASMAVGVRTSTYMSFSYFFMFFFFASLLLLRFCMLPPAADNQPIRCYPVCEWCCRCPLLEVYFLCNVHVCVYVFAASSLLSYPGMLVRHYILFMCFPFRLFHFANFFLYWRLVIITLTPWARAHTQCNPHQFMSISNACLSTFVWLEYPMLAIVQYSASFCYSFSHLPPAKARKFLSLFGSKIMCLLALTVLFCYHSSFLPSWRPACLPAFPAIRFTTLPSRA